MYFVCECGEAFDALLTGAEEHFLDKHAEMVETRFEDFIDEPDLFEDESQDEIYEEALKDVMDEMLDQFEEKD